MTSITILRMFLSPIGVSVLWTVPIFVRLPLRSMTGVPEHTKNEKAPPEWGRSSDRSKAAEAINAALARMGKA